MISDDAKDKVRLWITAIVVAPLLGGVVLFALDIDGFRAQGTDSIAALFTNCEELTEELTVDLKCLNNPSCTMTREELADSNERRDNFNKFCDDGRE